MTVKELIEELKQYPEDHLVVASKDGEGNNFSPISDLGQYIYIPENTWCGEVWSVQDYEDNREEDDAPPKEANCVVLWPTN